MAAPNPVDSALEAYRAKLIKANTGEVEKKFRKAFPDVTGEQITTLGRQGMLQRLMEQKKAELAKLAAPAVAPIVAADPMQQLLQMMLAQQKAAEAAEGGDWLSKRKDWPRRRKDWPRKPLPEKLLRLNELRDWKKKS